MDGPNRTSETRRFESRIGRPSLVAAAAAARRRPEHLLNLDGRSVARASQLIHQAQGLPTAEDRRPPSALRRPPAATTKTCPRPTSSRNPPEDYPRRQFFFAPPPPRCAGGRTLPHPAPLPLGPLLLILGCLKASAGRGYLQRAGRGSRVKAADV